MQKEPEPYRSFASNKATNDNEGLVSGNATRLTQVFALPRDCNDDAIPDACHLGDTDGDELIGLIDYADFHSCMTGPCGARFCDPSADVGVCCSIIDFHRDGGIDLEDWAEFRRAFGGP